MWVPRRSLRHDILFDRTGLRIEHADMRRSVARVPYPSVSGDDEIVWPGAVIEFETSELTAVRVQRGNVIAGLTDKPDMAATVIEGVARAGLWPGYRPLVDLNGVDRFAVSRNRHQPHKSEKED